MSSNRDDDLLRGIKKERVEMEREKMVCIYLCFLASMVFVVLSAIHPAIFYGSLSLGFMIIAVIIIFWKSLKEFSGEFFGNKFSAKLDQIQDGQDYLKKVSNALARPILLLLYESGRYSGPSKLGKEHILKHLQEISNILPPTIFTEIEKEIQEIDKTVMEKYNAEKEKWKNERPKDRITGFPSFSIWLSQQK